MGSKLLTDVELRAKWARSQEKAYCIEEGTIVTPAAQDFLRENGIVLTRVAPGAAQETMTRTPIPMRGGKAVFVEAATGRTVSEKREGMTHLRGNLLVPKTHPRIMFRGKLDTLQAQMLGVQLVAAEEGYPRVAEELEELLGCVRAILGAEVKEEPLAPMQLLSMDSAQIRRVSHHVREELGIDHPIPHYRMGRLCVALNRLRTQVREAELYAAAAFTEPDGACAREDIVEALNRLSSCVYILFCRKLAGFYTQERAK
jgi:ethanolamine utilization cobalamin adenosyltransferase